MERWLVGICFIFAVVVLVASCDPAAAHAEKQAATVAQAEVVISGYKAKKLPADWKLVEAISECYEARLVSVEEITGMLGPAAETESSGDLIESVYAIKGIPSERSTVHFRYKSGRLTAMFYE